VAQQATQVYYTSYACQTKEHLKGWAIMHKVSPHGKLSIPNDEDYNSTQTHMTESSIKKRGYKGGSR
jgi:hypothetical protein